MIIRAFLMSLGMFSAIPVPKNSWSDEYAHLTIPALPAVGAAIGLIWYAAAEAFTALSIPMPIRSALVLLVPFFLSGFIHTDGFMDTADAVFSGRPKEEALRILKDPRAGVFAVCAAISLFLLQFCTVYTIVSENRPLALFIFIPVVSRCAAGLALLRLRPLSDTGYLAVFRANTGLRHFAVVAGFLVLCFILAPAGIIPLAAELAAAICITAFVYKKLGGLSGDLCGCIITVAELAGLLAIGL